IAPMIAVFAAVVAWLTRRDREIPYGPWLSLATLLLLLSWTVVWPVARRIFDMGPLLFLMGLFMAAALVVCLQLVQLFKRAMGISPVTPEAAMNDVWSSADHLTYYNSERPDEQTGQWDRPQWPGCRAGRGLAHPHQWRSHGPG